MWAIQYIQYTKKVAIASRVVGLSNVRKISGSGETGDPTWYALRTDGTVVQGTILQGKTDTDPVSARVVGNLPLHFSDVTDIVTEGGPWALRSDGTMWFIYIPNDGHSGASMSPKGAQATPVQGLTDVTHLWGGIGQSQPVAETKSGKLFELTSGADRRTPIANAFADAKLCRGPNAGHARYLGRARRATSFMVLVRWCPEGRYFARRPRTEAPGWANRIRSLGHRV